MWLGIGLGTLVVAWLTRGAWTGSLLQGGDALFHLIRADQGIELLKQGQINGWSPRYYLGSDLFLFYGPGLVWFTALIKLIGLGALDNGTSLTVAVLISLLVVPAAVAFLARSMGLSYRTAGIAALLSPLVSTVWGVGIDGVFQNGLLTHQLGAVLWLLGLGCLIRVCRNPEPKWIVATAALAAYLAITSPVVLAMLAAVGLAAVAAIQFAERPGWKAPARALLVCVMTAGLAGFWLIPALAHRDLKGGSTWWGGYEPFELLGQILFGRLVLPPGVAAAAIVAAVVMVRRGNRSEWLLLVVPTVYLAIEAWAQTQPPRDMIVAQFQNHRGLGLVGLLLVIPLAWSLDALGRRARAWRTDRTQAASLAIITLVVAASMSPWAERARPHPEPFEQTQEAAKVLAGTVPAGGRFAFVRGHDELGATGTISPHHWLARYSGVPLLNGVGLETTRAHAAYRVGEDIANVSPEQSSRGLIKYGTTHLVTTDPDQTMKLANSGLFEVVWENSPIAILAVLPTMHGDPTWGLTGSAVVSARVIKVDSDNLMYLVETATDTSVDLAVAWSPHWRVRVNGEPVVAEQTGDWRTRIAVPQGDSVIDLQYRIDGWERLGLAMSIASAAGLTLWSRSRRSGYRIPSTGHSVRGEGVEGSVQGELTGLPVFAEPGGERTRVLGVNATSQDLGG